MRHMSRQGHPVFVDELDRFAARVADARLTRISALAASPLRIAVHGRPGAGCRTVTRALAASGLSVAQACPDADADADIEVRVIAETLKPEDRDAIAAARRPLLLVLNKADLTGFGSGGPVELARRRCGELAALTGHVTLPLVALLAVAAQEPLLDEVVLTGLRVLVDQPADLRSPDDFVAGEHFLPAALRVRLIETFDLFGIAHAVVALRSDPASGQSAALLRSVLHRVSGVDELIAHIAALGCEVRYRRMTEAVADLEILATISEDALAQQIWSLLGSDSFVVARMVAAVDVVQAAGELVDPADDPAAHLRRARHWQRYAEGPVSALHHGCGTDISRGSMRLLTQVSRGRSR